MMLVFIELWNARWDAINQDIAHICGMMHCFRVLQDVWVLQDVYSFRALVFYGWISMLYERMLWNIYAIIMKWCMKCGIWSNYITRCSGMQSNESWRILVKCELLCNKCVRYSGFDECYNYLWNDGIYGLALGLAHSYGFIKLYVVIAQACVTQDMIDG